MGCSCIPNQWPFPCRKVAEDTHQLQDGLVGMPINFLEYKLRDQKGRGCGSGDHVRRERRKTDAGNGSEQEWDIRRSTKVKVG